MRRIVHESYLIGTNEVITEAKVSWISFQVRRAWGVTDATLVGILFDACAIWNVPIIEVPVTAGKRAIRGILGADFQRIQFYQSPSSIKCSAPINSRVSDGMEHPIALPVLYLTAGENGQCLLSTENPEDEHAKVKAWVPPLIVAPPARPASVRKSLTQNTPKPKPKGEITPPTPSTPIQFLSIEEVCRRTGLQAFQLKAYENSGWLVRSDHNQRRYISTGVDALAAALKAKTGAPEKTELPAKKDSSSTGQVPKT